MVALRPLVEKPAALPREEAAADAWKKKRGQPWPGPASLRNADRSSYFFAVRVFVAESFLPFLKPFFGISDPPGGTRPLFPASAQQLSVSILNAN